MLTAPRIQWPVDHGRGHDVVAEHLTPAAERCVGGDDQAGPFVARGDQLEEQVGRFRLERDVAGPRIATPRRRRREYRGMAKERLLALGGRSAVTPNLCGHVANT